MHKKILIVSGFFPYPPMFGGVYDIWERIKGLRKLGCEIDLLFTDKKKPLENDFKHVKTFVGDLSYLHRENRVLDVFKITPLQVASRNKLETCHFDKVYDIVILESENVASVLDNKNLKADKIILRVHNNEAKYFLGLVGSTNNIFKKIYYYLESKKYGVYSKKVYKKVDRLWFISTDEELNYRRKTKNDKSINIPPPINQAFVSQSLKNKNVLFLGALFMDNNFEAIKWYLDNVHDKILAYFNDYSLTICGSTGSFSENYFINRFSKYKNVRLFFNVENLDEVYSESSLFINPMRHGAGVKLKTINAVVNGLPLVSTSTGAEGIGFRVDEMYCLANTPDEFEAHVKKLLESPDRRKQMVQKAQGYLKSNNYLDILRKELDLI